MLKHNEYGYKNIEQVPVQKPYLFGDFCYDFLHEVLFFLEHDTFIGSSVDPFCKCFHSVKIPALFPFVQINPLFEEFSKPFQSNFIEIQFTFFLVCFFS